MRLPNFLRLIGFITIFTISNARQNPGPKAIKNFYDTMFNDIKGQGQNLTFLRETFHGDWNTRPNPLNPTGKGPTGGPFPTGLKAILGLWGVMMPELYVERQHTLLCSDSTICGDKVVMLSKFGAKIGDLPPALKEFPMFPGIDPEKIKGKRFDSMAIDIQVIKNQKIKRDV